MNATGLRSLGIATLIVAATAIACSPLIVARPTPAAAAELATQEPLAGGLVLDVVSAKASRDPKTDEPVIDVQVSAASREALGRFSTSHLGEMVELIVDGKVVISLRILVPIMDGAMQIWGRRDMTQAEEEARMMMSGKVAIAPAAQP